MRGLISAQPDVPYVCPIPVRDYVPGMFLDDQLFLALAGALDELLAPIVAAIDSFDAYLDPHLAPQDFLGWLANLVGAPSRNRNEIAGAVDSYALRGTAVGLQAVAAAAAGVPANQVSVRDPGGVVWSVRARSAVPPPPGGTVSVRVVAAAGADIERTIAAVDEAMESARPVHTPVRVEVIAS